MFKVKTTRKSAKQLKRDPKSIEKIKEVLETLLKEREPFRREGYPRAGAFDRLSMVLIEEIEPQRLHLSFFHPAPRMVHKRELITEGQLKNLVLNATLLPINALLLVGYHPASGAIKYGEELNLQFAQLEQGIFLQALHKELTEKKVANHLQGGLRLEHLPVALPLDMRGVSGLVV